MIFYKNDTIQLLLTSSVLSVQTLSISDANITYYNIPLIVDLHIK